MYHRRHCSTSLYRSDQQLMSDMLRIACNLDCYLLVLCHFKGTLARLEARWQSSCVKRILVMSSCLSIRLTARLSRNGATSTGRIFREIIYSEIFYYSSTLCDCEEKLTTLTLHKKTTYLYRVAMDLHCKTVFCV